jgi:hypothetical protein
MRICVHHRHHRPTPYKGRLFLYFTACALTGMAFAAAGPLGWAALVLFFILPAAVFATVKFRRRKRAPRRATPDDGRDAGFQAAHVPASPAYKAAHPEGPRDWEQKAS